MEMTISKTIPAATFIAFGLALYIWHVAAALLGVFIANYFAISDPGPGLKSDIKKLSLCSLIPLSLFLAILYFTKAPVAFLIYILVFILSLKFAYLGANHGFLLIVLGSAMAGMLTFAMAVTWLGLKGVFFLYLVSFIAWWILYRSRQKNSRISEETRKRQERVIRDRVRSDPGFTTFCYQCLFYRQPAGRCQLKIDGEDVREITIRQRTYCPSFCQAPPDRPD